MRVWGVLGFEDIEFLVFVTLEYFALDIDAARRAHNGRCHSDACAKAQPPQGMMPRKEIERHRNGVLWAGETVKPMRNGAKNMYKSVLMPYVSVGKKVIAVS